MANNKFIYHLFFPKGKSLPFKKLRWTIMIVIQELLMHKFKSIFRIFYDKTYRKSIYHLRDILSKAPLTSEKTTMRLGDISYSHDINYPKWVDYLIAKLKIDKTDYKRIKTFFDTTANKWIVIDGNHRLAALNCILPPETEINVLKLTYVI